MSVMTENIVKRIAEIQDLLKTTQDSTEVNALLDEKKTLVTKLNIANESLNEGSGKKLLKG